MTGAALAQGEVFLTRAPIKPRAEDRLQSLPSHRVSFAMLAVVAGSLLVHLALMAGTILAARAPLVMPQEREIAVEIVREAPPPKPEPPKQVAKIEPPKPEPVKAEPVKAPPPEPPKAEPAKTEQPKVEQPAPAQAAPKAEDGNIKQLQAELASLRAEQEALKAETAQTGSGKAVALAEAKDGDGEMVDYQLLVFSQLAKAKERTTLKGSVGTTGVKFLIDDAGGLSRVEIVTPSGDADLDREALAIVRRAAPFPPPPKDAQRIVFANVNFVAPKQP